MINQEFEDYLNGKFKVDIICNILVEDIENNNKEIFLYKWKLFREKFTCIENLNISKIWKSLIEKEKISWFNNPYLPLPFNKNCHAVSYAAQKYYQEMNSYNKEILNICFEGMSKISKHSIIKELEDLKTKWTISVHESKSEKCRDYFNVINEIDNLYRSLNPPNADKFLTYIIIIQGKEIQLYNVGDNLTNSVFFNEVTCPLMEKLIEIDKIGANKLNNKKDSISLNDIYHFFQKYYQYQKLEARITNFPKKDIKDIKFKI